MTTAWKYDVPIDDFAHVFDMPTGAQIVHAGVGPTTPENHVSVWAVVDPNGTPESRTLFVMGTGDWAPSGSTWRATAVEPHRPLVWHVWEQS